MPKNYLSAKTWEQQRNAMRNKKLKTLPPIKDVRTQCWAVTISLKEDSGNTVETVQELFLKLEADDEEFAGCFSEEEGKKKDENGQGYLHAQAAVYWNKEKTGNWVLKQFEGTKAHIEPALNQQALATYVQKSKTHVSGPYRFGKWDELEDRLASSNKGKRNDLALIDRAVEEGKTYDDFVRDSTLKHSTINFRNYIREQTNTFYMDHYEPRSPLQDGIFSVDYIFGSPGSGKSRAVKDFYGPKMFKVSNKMMHTDFAFEGYQGQEVILFDEFESSLPFKDLLQYLEDYPYLANIKNSATPARWKKVIIASAIPLVEQYKGVLSKQDGSIKQLYRRLHHGRIIMQTQQQYGYPYATYEDALMGKWDDSIYPYSKSITEITGWAPHAEDESGLLADFMATDRTNDPLQDLDYLKPELRREAIRTPW